MSTRAALNGRGAPFGGVPARVVVGMALISETLLAALAYLLAYVFGLSFDADISTERLISGFWATGPLLAFNFGIYAVLANRDRYRIYKEFVREVVAPICANLNPLTAALVAISAGVGEELFFRGFLNPALSMILTPIVGIALASYLFAYVHFIGWLHVYWRLLLLYTLFGLYFSYLTLNQGHVITAVVSHALYNYTAIIFIRYYEIPHGSLLKR